MPICHASKISGEKVVREREEHKSKWLKYVAEIMSICRSQFYVLVFISFSHILPPNTIFTKKPQKKHYVLIWVHLRTYICIYMYDIHI